MQPLNLSKTIFITNETYLVLFIRFKKTATYIQTFGCTFIATSYFFMAFGLDSFGFFNLFNLFNVDVIT